MKLIGGTAAAEPLPSCVRLAPASHMEGTVQFLGGNWKNPDANRCVYFLGRSSGKPQCSASFDSDHVLGTKRPVVGLRRLHDGDDVCTVHVPLPPAGHVALRKVEGRARRNLRLRLVRLQFREPERLRERELWTHDRWSKRIWLCCDRCWKCWVCCGEQANGSSGMECEYAMSLEIFWKKLLQASLGLA